MANFALNITTDDVLELQGIINKLAGELPTVHSLPTDVEQATTYPAPTVDAKLEAAADVVPERDAHGIKRDLRIHSDAAEPIAPKSGTWKRRRGLSEVEYDTVYAELVSEAQAAGVYTGPAIEPQAAAAPAPTPASNDAAPAPTQQQAAAPAPAATGMSAEHTPLPPQVIMALVNTAGPRAAQYVLKAMQISNVTQATPEQLRQMQTMADTVKELGIAPADRLVQGPKALAEVAITMGYVLDIDAEA